MKAKIWDRKWWVKETDPKKLRKELGDLLKKSGFTILRRTKYHFQPQGFTKVWVLGESHLAVHTFPEEGKTYVQLSSCNKKMYDAFVKGMKKYG